MSFALNRANSVYLCAFAVFVIGIWVILDLGSALLTAPRDLSGNWRMTAAPAGQTPAAFSIAQSGRYLRFTFDHGPRFDVVLAQSGDRDRQTLVFHGEGWNVTGTGSPVAETMDFTFQPPPESTPLTPSGTYQRQRMGQENSSPTQSTAQHPPDSSPNAVH